MACRHFYFEIQMNAFLRRRFPWDYLRLRKMSLCLFSSLCLFFLSYILFPSHFPLSFFPLPLCLLLSCYCLLSFPSLLFSLSSFYPPSLSSSSSAPCFWEASSMLIFFKNPDHPALSKALPRPSPPLPHLLFILLGDNLAVIIISILPGRH